jgi:hypothetical protein
MLIKHRTTLRLIPVTVLVTALAATIGILIPQATISHFHTNFAHNQSLVFEMQLGVLVVHTSSHFFLTIWRRPPWATPHRDAMLQQKFKKPTTTHFNSLVTVGCDAITTTSNWQNATPAPSTVKGERL